MLKFIFCASVLLAVLPDEVATVKIRNRDMFWTCPAGKYDWFGCHSCSGGKYCPGDGKDYQCPPGKYSTGGAISCSYCPDGTASHDFGSDSCKACPSSQKCIVTTTKVTSALAKKITQGGKWTQLVYIKPVRFGLQHQEILEDSEEETMAIVGYSASLNTIIIFFRGTNNLKNYQQDFHMMPVDIPECDKCKVHPGFQIAHNSLRGKTEASVKKLKILYPLAGVTVMGHSLGGSMAVHECWRLTQKGIKCELITFGALRVGNQYFAKYINNYLGQHWRVVWQRDPAIGLVPHQILGYLHDGTEINFEGPKKYTIQPLFFDRVWHVPNLIFGNDHLSYHLIDI